MENINEYKKKLVKQKLDMTVKDCLFSIVTDARMSIKNVVKELIENGYATDGQSKIEPILNGHEVKIQIKFDEQLFEYSYKIYYGGEIVIDKVKDLSFNFEIINRPLIQLKTMIDGILVYNAMGGYKSIDKLHEDMKDLNYFFKKVNDASKFNP